MNGFCGAVDLKYPNIDFDILKRMSAYLGRSEGKDLLACALPGCVMICAGEQSEDFAPVLKSSGGHEYMAVALASAETLKMTDHRYVAQSLMERYVSGGRERLDGACSTLCAVIFNGAFGEAVMLVDGASERSIYYTLRGSTLYFSSELRAVLSVIESYDGTVKVDQDSLRRHLLGADDIFAENIFSGVERVGAGGGVTISRFGKAEFSMPCDDGETRARASGAVMPLERVKASDVCRSAEAALDLFGYPQFDAYLPSIIASLERTRAFGRSKRRCISESIPISAGLSDEYLAERARILSRVYGISVRTELCPKRIVGAGELVRLLSVERYLVNTVKKELEDKKSILYELFDGNTVLTALKREKSIPRGVRLAGMLYQTSVWFKKYNVSF